MEFRFFLKVDVVKHLKVFWAVPLAEGGSVKVSAAPGECFVFR